MRIGLLTALALLMTFSVRAQAEGDTLVDFRLMAPPEIEWHAPTPEGQIFTMQAGKPCTLQVVTRIAGEVVDIFDYGIVVEDSLGTAQHVPGMRNTFVVTPHTRNSLKRIRLQFHCITPGYRLLVPVPKEGAERLYDHDYRLIPEAVAGWGPLPDVDSHGSFLMDTRWVVVTGTR